MKITITVADKIGVIPFKATRTIYCQTINKEQISNLARSARKELKETLKRNEEILNGK